MNFNNLFNNKNTTVINSSNGKSVITINGTTYNVQGNNISVRNGTIYVGDNLVVGELNGIVEIKFEGNLANLHSDSSVTVNGNVEGDAESNGSMTVKGEIKGNAQSGGSMNCNNIGKNASSGGSMNCGNVGGNANSGGSMRGG